MSNPTSPPPPIRIQAVAGIAVCNGLVLLVYTDKHGVGLPAGKVRDGESHEDALRREVLEETGVNVTRVVSCLGPETGDIYECHHYAIEVDSTPPKHGGDAVKAWWAHPDASSSSRFPMVYPLVLRVIAEQAIKRAREALEVVPECPCYADGFPATAAEVDHLRAELRAVKEDGLRTFTELEERRSTTKAVVALCEVDEKLSFVTSVALDACNGRYPGTTPPTRERMGSHDSVYQVALAVHRLGNALYDSERSLGEARSALRLRTAECVRETENAQRLRSEQVELMSSRGDAVRELDKLRPIVERVREYEESVFGMAFEDYARSIGSDLEREHKAFLEADAAYRNEAGHVDGLLYDLGRARAERDMMARMVLRGDMTSVRRMATDVLRPEAVAEMALSVEKHGVRLTGWPAQVIAETIVDAAKGSDDFICWNIYTPPGSRDDDRKRKLLVTAQWADGKSPVDVIAELREEVASKDREIAELRERLSRAGDRP